MKNKINWPAIKRDAKIAGKYILAALFAITVINITTNLRSSDWQFWMLFMSIGLPLNYIIIYRQQVKKASEAIESACDQSLDAVAKIRLEQTQVREELNKAIDKLEKSLKNKKETK